MCIVAEVGSSDSAATTDRRLSAHSLAILVLIPADPAVHERSAQLFGDDVLVCIPLNDEAQAESLGLVPI